MGAYQVVVTDYDFQNVDIERNIMAEYGIEFIPAQCRTEEEVIRAAKKADGILNQYAPITADVIEQLENCQVIARYGVGVNTIDVEAATKKGIIISNVTDYCLDEVSDHALALLLALARKIVVLNQSVKNGKWDVKKAKPVFRLKGCVLGLVGFGNIPQTLAVKAQSLGLKVMAYDPFVPSSIADALGVKLVRLEELLQTSDFVSVHLPLNRETKGIISRQAFELMKKEAFIINTARGPVIDESALNRALSEKQIAGAALDVVEKEPIDPNSPLLNMEEVILTPHAAWYSEEAEFELKRKSAQNIVDVLNGYYPDYMVNPSVKSRLRLAKKERKR
ncbi:C-terminal binding protein [Bacillus smithii]|uniref:C-terminal binding protein n=1 Tax=Bacillus smithii TaxID=1479 RepID=UPI002E241770|nr:C-terminal binding protein [Bacillus smithii]MED1456401.1 C-terminal binding protein [Bacillus smithii]